MSARGALDVESDVKPTGLFPWWLVLVEGVAATVMAFRLRKSPGVAASAVNPVGAVRAADPEPT